MVMEIGLEADLAWCAALDATTVVPHVAAADLVLPLLRIEPWVGQAGASR
jgi:hypothetical protein